MRSVYSSPLKVISLLLIGSFLVEQLAFAAPDFKPTQNWIFDKPTVDLRFPESVASVEDAWSAGSGTRTVYLFQDAHANLSGQTNLSRALDHLLQREAGLRWIFMEGGSGDTSLSFLREKAPADKRRAVADRYLKKGLLHGEEHLDLSSDRKMTLWGVEDLSLYAKALDAYKKTAKDRDKFLVYLAGVDATAESLKPVLLNPRLLALDRSIRRYRKNEMAVTEYADALVSAARDAGVETDGFKDLKLFSKLRDEESKIDFKQASLEQAKAVSLFSETDRKEMTDLSESAGRSPFKVAGEDKEGRVAFYAALREKLANRLVEYHEFSKYLTYLENAKKIQAESILIELSNLEKKVLAALSWSADEEDLPRASEVTALYKKLFQLQMTPEEYRAYKTLTSSFGIDRATGFLNKKIVMTGTARDRALLLENGFEDIVKNAETFYDLTLSRDEAMVNNMLKKLEWDTQAVLIAGGFHAVNLKSILKSKNISYISIRPQIFHETSIRRYEEKLFDQKLNPVFAQKLAGPSTLREFTARMQSTVMTPLMAEFAGARMANDASGIVKQTPASQPAHTRRNFLQNVLVAGTLGVSAAAQDKSKNVESFRTISFSALSELSSANGGYVGVIELRGLDRIRAGQRMEIEFEGDPAPIIGKIPLVTVTVSRSQSRKLEDALKNLSSQNGVVRRNVISVEILNDVANPGILIVAFAPALPNERMALRFKQIRLYPAAVAPPKPAPVKPTPAQKGQIASALSAIFAARLASSRAGVWASFVAALTLFLAPDFVQAQSRPVTNSKSVSQPNPLLKPFKWMWKALSGTSAKPEFLGQQPGTRQTKVIPWKSPITLRNDGAYRGFQELGRPQMYVADAGVVMLHLKEPLGQSGRVRLELLRGRYIDSLPPDEDRLILEAQGRAGDAFLSWVLPDAISTKSETAKSKLKGLSNVAVEAASGPIAVDRIEFIYPTGIPVNQEIVDTVRARLNGLTLYFDRVAQPAGMPESQIELLRSRAIVQLEGILSFLAANSVNQNNPLQLAEMLQTTLKYLRARRNTEANEVFNQALAILGARLANDASGVVDRGEWIKENGKTVFPFTFFRSPFTSSAKQTSAARLSVQLPMEQTALNRRAVWKFLVESSEQNRTRYFSIRTIQDNSKALTPSQIQTIIRNFVTAGYLEEAKRTSGAEGPYDPDRLASPATTGQPHLYRIKEGIWEILADAGRREKLEAGLAMARTIRDLINNLRLLTAARLANGGVNAAKAEGRRRMAEKSPISYRFNQNPVGSSTTSLPFNFFAESPSKALVNTGRTLAGYGGWIFTTIIPLVFLGGYMFVFKKSLSPVSNIRLDEIVALYTVPFLVLFGVNAISWFSDWRKEAIPRWRSSSIRIRNLGKWNEFFTLNALARIANRGTNGPLRQGGITTQDIRHAHSSFKKLENGSNGNTRSLKPRPAVAERRVDADVAVNGHDSPRKKYIMPHSSGQMGELQSSAARLASRHNLKSLVAEIEAILDRPFRIQVARGAERPFLDFVLENAPQIVEVIKQAKQRGEVEIPLMDEEYMRGPAAHMPADSPESIWFLNIKVPLMGIEFYSDDPLSMDLPELSDGSTVPYGNEFWTFYDGRIAINLEYLGLNVLNVISRLTSPAARLSSFSRESKERPLEAGFWASGVAFIADAYATRRGQTEAENVFSLNGERFRLTAVETPDDYAGLQAGTRRLLIQAEYGDQGQKTAPVSIRVFHDQSPAGTLVRLESILRRAVELKLLLPEDPHFASKFPVIATHLDRTRLASAARLATGRGEPVLTSRPADDESAAISGGLADKAARRISTAWIAAGFANALAIGALYVSRWVGREKVRAAIEPYRDNGKALTPKVSARWASPMDVKAILSVQEKSPANSIIHLHEDTVRRLVENFQVLIAEAVIDDKKQIVGAIFVNSSKRGVLRLYDLLKDPATHKRDGEGSFEPFMEWLSLKYSLDLTDKSRLAQKFRRVFDPLFSPAGEKEWNAQGDEKFQQLAGLLLRQYLNENPQWMQADRTLGGMHSALGAHMIAIYANSRPYDEEALRSNVLMSYEAVPYLQKKINDLLRREGHSRPVGARLAADKVDWALAASTTAMLGSSAMAVVSDFPASPWVFGAMVLTVVTAVLVAAKVSRALEKIGRGGEGARLAGRAPKFSDLEQMATEGIVVNTKKHGKQSLETGLYYFDIYGRSTSFKRSGSQVSQGGTFEIRIPFKRLTTAMGSTIITTRANAITRGPAMGNGPDQGIQDAFDLALQAAGYFREKIKKSQRFGLMFDVTVLQGAVQAGAARDSYFYAQIVLKPKARRTTATSAARLAASSKTATVDLNTTREILKHVALKFKSYQYPPEVPVTIHLGDETLQTTVADTEAKLKGSFRPDTTYVYNRGDYHYNGQTPERSSVEIFISVHSKTLDSRKEKSTPNSAKGARLANVDALLTLLQSRDASAQEKIVILEVLGNSPDQDGSVTKALVRFIAGETSSRLIELAKRALAQIPNTHPNEVLSMARNSVSKRNPKPWKWVKDYQSLMGIIATNRVLRENFSTKDAFNVANENKLFARFNGYATFSLVQRALSMGVREGYLAKKPAGRYNENHFVMTSTGLKLNTAARLATANAVLTDADRQTRRITLAVGKLPKSKEGRETIQHTSGGYAVEYTSAGLKASVFLGIIIPRNQSRTTPTIALNDLKKKLLSARIGGFGRFEGSLRAVVKDLQNDYAIESGFGRLSETLLQLAQTIRAAKPEQQIRVFLNDVNSRPLGSFGLSAFPTKEWTDVMAASIIPLALAAGRKMDDLKIDTNGADIIVQISAARLANSDVNVAEVNGERRREKGKAPINHLPLSIYRGDKVADGARLADVGRLERTIPWNSVAELTQYIAVAQLQWQTKKDYNRTATFYDLQTPDQSLLVVVRQAPGLDDPEISYLRYEGIDKSKAIGEVVVLGPETLPLERQAIAEGLAKKTSWSSRTSNPTIGRETALLFHERWVRDDLRRIGISRIENFQTTDGRYRDYAAQEFLRISWNHPTQWERLLAVLAEHAKMGFDGVYINPEIAHSWIQGQLTDGHPSPVQLERDLKNPTTLIINPFDPSVLGTPVAAHRVTPNVEAAVLTLVMSPIPGSLSPQDKAIIAELTFEDAYSIPRIGIERLVKLAKMRDWVSGAPEWVLPSPSPLSPKDAEEERRVYWEVMHRRVSALAPINKSGMPLVVAEAIQFVLDHPKTVISQSSRDEIQTTLTGYYNEQRDNPAPSRIYEVERALEEVALKLVVDAAARTLDDAANSQREIFRREQEATRRGARPDEVGARLAQSAAPVGLNERIKNLKVDIVSVNLELRGRVEADLAHLTDLLAILHMAYKGRLAGERAPYDGAVYTIRQNGSSYALVLDGQAILTINDIQAAVARYQDRVRSGEASPALAVAGAERVALKQLNAAVGAMINISENAIRGIDLKNIYAQSLNTRGKLQSSKFEVILRDLLSHAISSTGKIYIKNTEFLLGQGYEANTLFQAQMAQIAKPLQGRMVGRVAPDQVVTYVLYESRSSLDASLDELRNSLAPNELAVIATVSDTEVSYAAAAFLEAGLASTIAGPHVAGGLTPENSELLEAVSASRLASLMSHLSADRAEAGKIESPDVVRALKIRHPNQHLFMVRALLVVSSLITAFGIRAAAVEHSA